MSKQNKIFWYTIICLVFVFLYLPGSLLAKEIQLEDSFGKTQSISKKLSQRLKGAGGSDKFPQSSILIVTEEVSIDLEPDGRFIKSTYLLYKVLNETGKNILRKRVFAYHKLYNKIHIRKARIIRSGLQTEKVPEDLIYDISSLKLSDQNIYDENARAKVVLFKNLEIGDTIEMLIDDECFNPPMEGVFSDISLLKDYYPIVFKSIRILAPDDMNLNFAIRDGQADFSKNKLDEKIVYEWKVSNVERICKEPSMPPLVNFAPRLVISNIRNWEDVSKWYYHLANPKMVVEGALKEEADRLAELLTTDEEKIYAVFRFVSSKIRYMGLGTGVNKGYIPKSARETYRSRYGICRDVAALMAAMLNYLDIEAYVALTSLGYEVDRQIPSLSFNHAIVAIRDAGGGYIFADPTMKNTGRLLVSQEHDQAVLISTPDGESLSRTPERSSHDNMAHIKANSEIGKNGDLRTTVKFSTSGIYDSYFRYSQSSASVEQTRRWIERNLQLNFPGAKVTSLKRDYLKGQEHPYFMEFEFEIKDYAVYADDLLQLKLPLSYGNLDMLSSALFRSTKLPVREHDWNIGTTFGVSEEETMIIPAGYSILSIPDAQNLSSGAMTYEMNYESLQSRQESGQTVSYKRKLLINKKFLKPAEYKHLKSILKAINRSTKGEVILVKSI